MQLPTLVNVHVHTTEEAHKIFYAVELGRLPKIEKRLDAHERAALRPGNVYVWEDKPPSSGSYVVTMQRFTEGKAWSQSRSRCVINPSLSILITVNGRPEMYVCCWVPPFAVRVNIQDRISSCTTRSLQRRRRARWTRKRRLRGTLTLPIVDGNVADSVILSDRCKTMSSARTNMTHLSSLPTLRSGRTTATSPVALPHRLRT